MGWEYFILGLVMGSAANAIVDRLPVGKSWFEGRSRCDTCRRVLTGWDLVPVVSYLWLGGKCRYCHSPIPIRNLGVEIAMGCGFFILGRWSGGSGWEKLSLLGGLWVTMIIAVMDWETQLVSEALVGVWGGVVVLGQLNNLGSWSHWGGAAFGVGLMGGIWAVTRGKAMGFGDVEIAAVLGWWLGWPAVAVAAWLAFVTGGAVGVGLMAVQKRGWRSQMAFGPFLVMGAWGAYFFGDMIWRGIFGF